MLDDSFIQATEETLDDLILGGMKMIQPKKGYRFSLDAVLLAHFVVLKGVKTVVDLGTGNGIIPLLLSHRCADLRIIGVEIQEAMVKRAQRNVLLNHKEAQIEMIRGDIREIENTLAPGGLAQLVLSNPPFWRQGEGKISQNQEEAIARHELYLDMEALLDRAFYLLAPGGKLAMIQRADRLEEIMQRFTTRGFSLTRVRFIHSYADRSAKLLLMEGQKQGRGTLAIMPPLIIYQKPGEYGEEIKQLYHLNA
jgi:tRNA1Val (adenine37-N6)-methyltransferase